jgi:hypothetical protein
MSIYELFIYLKNMFTFTTSIYFYVDMNCIDLFCILQQTTWFRVVYKEKEVYLHSKIKKKDKVYLVYDSSG